MSQITILLSFLLAGAALCWSRLQPGSRNTLSIEWVGIIAGSLAVGLGALKLWSLIFAVDSSRLGLGAVLALVGLEVGMIALASALSLRLRGLAGILFLLAGLMSLGALSATAPLPVSTLGMPLRVHAVSSLVAYSLLAVGAIVAVCALLQDRQLRTAKTDGWIQLLPPLAETERLVYAVAIGGFVALSVSIATGIIFVSDLFAQHLVHKTVLSIIAFFFFGTLLVGRAIAGWRGQAALRLYLAGFGILVLAYFGSRFVLETLLERQWG